MAGNIRGHIAGLLQTSKRHTRYVGILALLAVVVALGVTMGLRRNGRAATVEQTVLDCHAAAGVAHTHNADCYVGGDLVCPLQERELHVHDDSCYDEAGNLVCGKEEAAEEHVHGAGCFKTVTKTVEDEAEAQPAEATAETTADAPKAGELTASRDGYDVTVSYGADAKVPDGAKLTVKALSENSSEYKAAREAVLAQKLAEDEDFDETTLGMVAVDISILDASGAKVEPSDSVKVDLKLTKLPKNVDKSVLNASLEVLHLDESTGDTVVETVAESDEVKVASNAAKATFTVDSFSTFPLTWDNGAKTATIHFGTSTETAFTEFEQETINFDTSATSFSVENTFEGYLCTGAVYCEPGQAFKDGVDMDSVLHKDGDGWKLTKITHNANEEEVKEDIPVEDGSNIYVSYFVPGTAPASGADIQSVPSPTVEKEVTSNGDGTYDIQLDVVGTTVPEDHSHYANVLIVLDATKSMGQNGGAKWTNAKAAMKTLIETLTEGENAANAGKIDFALVTFGRSATVAQNWTKNNTAFKDTCANVSMVTTSGTNWEAGMRGALYGVLNNMPDNDPTYVTFLTDGDPNVYYSSGSDTNYTNSGTTNGWSQPGDESANHSSDEAKAIAAQTKLYGIYCGDSGVNPSGTSFNRLVKVITGQGQGGVKTIAANANTIESEFQLIAQTIVDELGASNVSVDDGIPSLSSVNAAVVGEAGAFRYEISTDGTTYNTWTDAPGASYSNDNGVTWDLSEVGTVSPGTHYRVTFTVWPSQAAYDTIADLNNHVITMTDEELAAAGIAKNNDDVYTLKTNTHLKMNYTFKDQDYQDNASYEEQAMLLPTETISVMKLWKNFLDSRDDADIQGLKLELTKDGNDYLPIDVSAQTDWKAEDIFISCGQISSGEIKEYGHDYCVTEHAASEAQDLTEYWEIDSPIYRPMVIDGVAHILVEKEASEVTGTEGQDYFILPKLDNNGKPIDGKVGYYQKDDQNTTMSAFNERVSWLNIQKVLADGAEAAGADPDTLFEYTVTITEPTPADVYFSVRGEGVNYRDDIETSATKTVVGGNTYYRVASDTQFTVKIKQGWNLRILNLASGTTYSIQETNIPEGFAFQSAQAVETLYQAKGVSAEGYPKTTQADGDTVTGTINQNNTDYTVTYTNKWETSDFNIQKVDDKGNILKGAEFTLTKNGAEVTAFDADALKNSGQITGLKLGSGVYCLTETVAPDGYNILENKVYFKIAKDGNSYKASICDADGNAATNDKAQVIDNGLTVQVSNTPGSALPMTGGPGTALYNILGSAIATAAVLTYLLLSRRTSEGRSWV